MRTHDPPTRIQRADPPRVVRPAESASDVEGDGFGDDFRVVSQSERKIYEVEHTSLSQPDVEKLMRSDVDHISGIFGVEVRRPLPWNPRLH